jgi:hypothetical protein
MLLLFPNQPCSEYRINIYYKLMGTDLVCCYINLKRLRENKVLGSFVEYRKEKIESLNSVPNHKLTKVSIKSTKHFLHSL